MDHPEGASETGDGRLGFDRKAERVNDFETVAFGI